MRCEGPLKEQERSNREYRWKAAFDPIPVIQDASDSDISRTVCMRIHVTQRVQADEYFPNCGAAAIEKAGD